MRKDDPVLILENAKFIWPWERVEQACRLFAKGVKPTQVAQIMGEDVLDIGLLLLHLMDKGWIECA
ncbi:MULTISPECIES: hypothetical protein [Enterococcus]|uniref:Uncharacterized protein n=2 Tax=Enterococcus TaxID=1350 RepID=R2QR18_9ENTE|nr:MULTISPECIES: hypothetical protein [Enterococcus]HDU2614977.1 hypothetical protein [Enterococcus faecalis]EOH74105.1 hypothetical protein UAK_03925 [Enterococcus raffinosus ATCC 49464]EOT82241.1 hypothetical protein I590_00666 [Enterococcus raffinosus ATCC 49464]PAB01090.1 hypothetical protein AKL21_07490 [Enterococcus canintestini]UXK04510.1 hypothetical protein N7K38_01720 [Enterococcus raffinosus]